MEYPSLDGCSDKEEGEYGSEGDEGKEELADADEEADGRADPEVCGGGEANDFIFDFEDDASADEAYADGDLCGDAADVCSFADGDAGDGKECGAKADEGVCLDAGRAFAQLALKAEESACEDTNEDPDDEFLFGCHKKKNWRGLPQGFGGVVQGRPASEKEC